MPVRGLLCQSHREEETAYGGFAETSIMEKAADRRPLILLLVSC